MKSMQSSACAGKTPRWQCAHHDLALTCHGPGLIVVMEGTVDVPAYANLARKNIIPFMFQLMDQHGHPFRLVEDNAPAHNYRIAMEAFEKSGADHVDWAPYSPDLSPIENLWTILKTRLDALPTRPTDGASL